MPVSSSWWTDDCCCVAGLSRESVIQQLVRAFEVKRLTTSKLHDVRRHRLNSSDDQHHHHHHQQQQQQARLARRLVDEFNNDDWSRRACLRADDRQLTDVNQFEKYLRCTSILTPSPLPLAPQFTDRNAVFRLV